MTTNKHSMNFNATDRLGRVRFFPTKTLRIGILHERRGEFRKDGIYSHLYPEMSRDAEALQGAILDGSPGNRLPWGVTRAALVNGLVMAAIIGAAIVAIV